MTATPTDAGVTGPTAVAEQIVPLSRLRPCFEGAVPAVIATAAADGTPNVTYLSRVRMVDDDHVAVSNQFFSKTSRNLAENPRASLLVVDPTTYDEYRLTLDHERTERRGPTFERLRDDVAAVASIQGMQDVFHLRAADVYRVVGIEARPGRVREGAPSTDRPVLDPGHDADRLAELTRRLSRSADLDTLVGAAVDGLAELFDYRHTILLLTDECAERLYTIASHGYEAEGVGSEVVIGEGIVGMAASRCRPIRIGNLRQMSKYSTTVRRSFEDRGAATGRDIPLPGLAGAQSQLAVPVQALGELVGVLVVESERNVAYDEADEHRLVVVASLVGAAVELERARARSASGTPSTTPAASAAATAAPATAAAADPGAAPTVVRHYGADGSTFLDGEYLIKGVAGRILWSLLCAHRAEGRTEFTNREVRLDPSLELPEIRDNFESRLILLKRRLDERHAPVRVEKTGRGRFRLVVERPLRLESVTPT